MRSAIYILNSACGWNNECTNTKWHAYLYTMEHFLVLRMNLYNNVYGIYVSLSPASVLRKLYMNVDMWKTLMCIKLSKADTKILWILETIQRLCIEFASNLRLFNWNFLNNEEFVRYMC